MNAVDIAARLLPRSRSLRRVVITDVIVYGIGAVLLAYVAWRLTLTLTSGTYSLGNFIRDIIAGLAQGGVYALIALGYTLVYGILFMINFAHSEVFMAGAYVGYFAITAMKVSGLLDSQPLVALLIVMAIAMAASITIAIGLERIAYRPLRTAPRLVPLITAIGASIFLQQSFRGLFGTNTKVYPDVRMYAFPQLFPHLEDGKGINLTGGIYRVEAFGIDLSILPLQFLIFFTSVAIMIGLYLFVKRTKTGKAMRAVAEDKATAALMGINVDRVIVTTFVVGAALAAVAGVLYALYFGQVTHTMGFIPGIKAFTAAVLGGIGNIPGAMLGGFALGLTEAAAPSLLGITPQLKDVIAFSMLVLVLIFRPTGILGEVLSRKKA